MNELTFSLRDLYPNIATTQEETSHKANPDAEDQTVLNEDANLSEKADNNNASSKTILIAIIIIVALVVLFGTSKQGCGKMGINEINEIISTLGFPVAMVLYFIWDKYKVTSNLVQAINNNNKILTMLLTKLALVEEGLENE